MEVGSKALIVLTVVPCTLQVIVECCYLIAYDMRNHVIGKGLGLGSYDAAVIFHWQFL